MVIQDGIKFFRRNPTVLTDEDYLILADTVVMFFPADNLADFVKSLDRMCQEAHREFLDYEDEFRYHHLESFLRAMIQCLHDRDYWFEGGFGAGPLVMCHQDIQAPPEGYQGPVK